MLFITTACQKEIEKEVQNQNPVADCYLKDGRLIFKDNETFKEHLQWVFDNQNNPNAIKQKYEVLGLISLKVVYDEGMEIDDNEDMFQQYVAKHPKAFHKVDFDNSIIYELPTASVLAYLANENGIYQIGDKIFRRTFDYNLELSADNINKFDQLLLPKFQVNDPDIKVTQAKDESSLKTPGKYSFKTAYIQRNKPGAQDIRLVARLYKFYADGPGGLNGCDVYDVRTTAQQKKWWGWAKKTIVQLGHSWSQGYYKYYDWNYPNTISARSNIKQNASDVQESVINAWWVVDHSQSSCLVNHTGSHGNTATITNNEVFR